MPSNPLTQEEINSYVFNRILNPEGYTGLSPYMPGGYFLSTPAIVNGPALWRLFDASFISSGIIDRNRLGTGSTGAGTKYLADDSTWKTISVPATPTLAQVTTEGNTTTNAITVGGLTVNTNTLVVDSVNNRVGIGTTNPVSTLQVENSLNTAVQSLVSTPTAASLLLSNTGNSVALSIAVSNSNLSYLQARQKTGTGNAFNLGLNPLGGNVLIGTTTDAGQKLQVIGSVFIKGADSLSSTKVFEVQNGAGASIMDFRNATYAFFGCGQGGGSNSGFIFNYSNTSYTQFAGYNYGAGSGAYKPILMDTDTGGRNQGIFVNFGTVTLTPPNSDTEFAVRGRTSDDTTYISRFRNSTNLDKFEIRADGALFTNTLQGYSGTLSIPGNPSGSTTITITNGLITNIA